MPRPKPTKEQGANIAVVCNLTEQCYAPERSYGIFPLLPVIPGIQYIARCAQSVARLKAERAKVEWLDTPGIPKQKLADCEPGEEFALTEIADTWAAREESGDKKTKDLIGAYDIADDLCREINTTLVMGISAVAGAPFAGLFVCEGERPTAGELKRFREKLSESDQSRVEAADDAYSVYKNRMFCVDAIAAAKRLGVDDREWLSAYKPTKNCPVCFEKLNPQAAVCRGCGHIVDPERAVQLKFLKAEPKEQPKPPRTI